MKKEEVLHHLTVSGVIAVVRGDSPEKAVQMAETCIMNGICGIELTFTVPYAQDALKILAQKYEENNEVMIGAGTVLDSETARIAILCGAQFIVSPHFDEKITRLCNRYRIASMAGIMTVTEAIHAMEAGVDILKLFPGEMCGPSYIKALHGPLPQAQIMPTGGVNADNVAQWIKNGAVAVGVGSDLTRGDPKEKCKSYLAAVKAARKG